MDEQRIREIVREELAAQRTEHQLHIDAEEFAKQLAVNVNKTLRDIFKDGQKPTGD